MLPAAACTCQACCRFNWRAERWGLAKNLATCAGELRGNGVGLLARWQSVSRAMGRTGIGQLIEQID